MGFKSKQMVYVEVQQNASLAVILENVKLTDADDEMVWEDGSTVFTTKKVAELIWDKKRQERQLGFHGFPFFRIWKVEIVPPKIVFFCWTFFAGEYLLLINYITGAYNW